MIRALIVIMTLSLIETWPDRDEASVFPRGRVLCRRWFLKSQKMSESESKYKKPEWNCKKMSESKTAKWNVEVKKINFTRCLHWVEIVVKRGSIVPGLEGCNGDNDNGEGGADPNGDTDGDI